MKSVPVLAALITLLHVTQAFLAPQQNEQTRRNWFSKMYAKGDSLREATGIRPSLHPTTINAIADALRARARKTEGIAFRVSDDVQPMDIALTAGKFASTAISKRQGTSDQDGMKLTAKEEQTIAGRVVGVVMRLEALEEELLSKVSEVSWVAKYNEWGSFGVLPSGEGDVDTRIKDDPLFAMCRSECLLAIFLHNIEAPQLAKVGETVPDESKIDFLDSDRVEALLS